MIYTPRQLALLAEWKAVMTAQIKAAKQRMDSAANYDAYIPASNEKYMLQFRLGGHIGFLEWAAAHSEVA